MFRARSAVPAALLLATLAACGDDEVGPKTDEITGNWTATKVEFVSKAAPATRVDIIAQGSKVAVGIHSDKSFHYIQTDPGAQADTTNAVWKLDGDAIKITPTASPWSYEYDVSLKGSTLTLMGGDVEFDFNDDDVPEMADQNMTLVR